MRVLQRSRRCCCLWRAALSPAAAPPRCAPNLEHSARQRRRRGKWRRGAQVMPLTLLALTAAHPAVLHPAAVHPAGPYLAWYPQKKGCCLVPLPQLLLLPLLPLLLLPLPARHVAGGGVRRGGCIGPGTRPSRTAACPAARCCCRRARGRVLLPGCRGGGGCNGERIRVKQGIGGQKDRGEDL